MAGLVTIAELKSWAQPNIDSDRDAELTQLCLRASEWVEQQASWEIEQASRTTYYDGGEICGTILFLPARHRYVKHTSPDFVTVSEDGSSLTVATGYDASVDVILADHEKREGQCRLIRRGSWSYGVQNIAVSYKSGYATADVPADIKQVALEVAWLFFRAPQWIGRSSQTKSGHGSTLEKELTPQSTATLERLRLQL